MADKTRKARKARKPPRAGKTPAAGPPRQAERLRKIALGYPETYEESPWGDRVVKVRGKIFLFAGQHEGKLHLSVKLPRSSRKVLAEPFARPTPYGLGKSGWVSCSFDGKRKVDEARIAAWIDESYRAIAPKRLVAALDAAPGAATPAPARAAAAPAHPRAEIHKRVVLLCHDALRAARATRALASRGVRLEVVEDAEAVRARVRARTLDAVIIDVGRSQDDGLALAGEIDASDDPILVFVVGIRDGRAEKRAKNAATSADLYRAPPGEPAVADAVAETLARYS